MRVTFNRGHVNQPTPLAFTLDFLTANVQAHAALSGHKNEIWEIIYEAGERIAALANHNHNTLEEQT